MAAVITDENREPNIAPKGGRAAATKKAVATNEATAAAPASTAAKKKGASGSTSAARPLADIFVTAFDAAQKSVVSHRKGVLELRKAQKLASPDEFALHFQVTLADFLPAM